MGADNKDLLALREALHKALVEVEMAVDTQTYPDWAETKENLLKAIEMVRRLERDQIWSKLPGKR
ncbi:MAG TPA: hypothetical protein VFV34_18560 [Blastocatellia bacterium]|nr:hypothetical protein [Blastocatellia bacterium]